jgi:predicted DNA-binding mobile mystery protein A
MALGLTTAQLAKKIGTQAPGINQFENNEITKKATLGSLDRAARAMNCQLVWAIIPGPGYGSLSEIVEYRAGKLAEKIVKTVDQTMNLEAQGIHSEISAKKIIELTMDLIRDGDSRIWEPMDGETND